MTARAGRVARARWLLALLCVAAPALAQPAAPRSGVVLGPPTAVAAGIELFRPDARALMDPPGPIVVLAIRVDPTRARLAMALARDVTPARQTVTDIARAHGALVAINASFFDARGRQVGLAKIDGEHLKTNARARGAVAWSPGTVPVFDRVHSTLAIRPAGSSVAPVPVGFVNPTALRLGLSLFSRSFGPRVPGTTGTIGGPEPAADEDGMAPASAPPAPTDDPAALAPGVHVWRWLLAGSPWRVRQAARDGQDYWTTNGSTLLMWRGTEGSLPEPLRDVRADAAVDLIETWTPRLGTPADAWRTATYAIAGAGLLMQGGRALDEWSPEDLRAGFTHERHPRTVIGRDGDGRVWLLTVDGRRPKVSVGMSFPELQRLGAALGLRDALNLDGGGSTTMVVRGAVVNHPSDPGGARPVPDAILVMPMTAGTASARLPAGASS